MQFSLNVENLESAFLAGGLAKYSAADFTTAGFTTAIRSRFQQIADSEALHVTYLTKAIGTDDAPVACTYDLYVSPHPRQRESRDGANAQCASTNAYTDVTSFVNLAQKIESIGASAYLGLAGALNATSLKEGQTTLVLTAGGVRTQSYSRVVAPADRVSVICAVHRRSEGPPGRVDHVYRAAEAALGRRVRDAAYPQRRLVSP